MKVVLDTNVLISATLWDGSVAQKLLYSLIREDADIFSSIELLEEYNKVLKRDFQYNDIEINRVINVILSFVKIVEPLEHLDIIKSDPEDNKVLECAAASSSKFIFTYDKHLLSLKNFRDIRIIKPEEILRK